MIENIFKRAVFVSDKELLSEKLKNPENLKVLVDFNFDTEDFHLGHWMILSKLKELIKYGTEVNIVLNDFILGLNHLGSYYKNFSDKLNSIFSAGKFSVLSSREVLKSKETKDLLTPAALTNIRNLLKIDFIKERSDVSKDTIGLSEFLEQLIPPMVYLEVEPDIILCGENKGFYIDLAIELFRTYEKPPPVGIVFPLLTGKNGESKMSFKNDNAINIEESGVNLFNQIHQIPDSQVLDYFRLLTLFSDNRIAEIEGRMPAASDRELVQIKNDLAKEIVRSLGKDTEAMHEFKLNRSELKNGKIWIVRLLELAELVQSRGEGKRLVKHGGIKVNNKRIEDPDQELQIEDGAILSKGKKIKIKITLL
ncbi:S4 domain-containing protein [candidate division KSB1 bacterium]